MDDDEGVRDGDDDDRDGLQLGYVDICPQLYGDSTFGRWRKSVDWKVSAVRSRISAASEDWMAIDDDEDNRYQATTMTTVYSRQEDGL